MNERMDQAIDAAWPTVREAIRTAARGGGDKADILDRAQTPGILALIERVARKYGVSESALTEALLEDGDQMDAALAVSSGV